MNFFPFHPGDYMLRTAHLEPLEDLAYRRMIDLYYVNETPLEGNPEAIARVIRMRSSATEVEAVLREFFIEGSDGWSHTHCDEVIGQYQAKAKQAVENGKRGGRPKKPEGNPELNKQEPEVESSDSENNPEITQGFNSAIPEETGSQANQEPRTNNQIDKDQKTFAADASAPQVLEADATLQTTTTPDQPKAAKGTRLVADWTLPQEWLDWAVSDRPEIGETLLRREADSFRDHWHSTPGSKGCKTSWLATWRNWVRRANAPRNVHAFPAKSNFQNLPQVNAAEIRARTAENERLGKRHANF